MTNEYPEDTIYDPELALAARKDHIQHITIVQTNKGFYIIVKLKRITESVMLTTRRHPDQPRYFKQFERLITRIRTAYPGVEEVKMRFVEPYPANPDLKYVGEPEIELAIQPRRVGRVAKKVPVVAKGRK